MAKKVIIRISKDGKAKVSAHGYTGTGCLDSTKAIEEAMGMAEDRKYTEEFYAIEHGVEQVRQK